MGGYLGWGCWGWGSRGWGLDEEEVKEAKGCFFYYFFMGLIYFALLMAYLLYTLGYYAGI
jgi:hypothetical protein